MGLFLVFSSDQKKPQERQTNRLVWAYKKGGKVWRIDTIDFMDTWHNHKWFTPNPSTSTTWTSFTNLPAAGFSQKNEIWLSEEVLIFQNFSKYQNKPPLSKLSEVTLAKRQKSPEEQKPRPLTRFLITRRTVLFEENKKILFWPYLASSI